LMITMVKFLDLPLRLGFERHPDAKARSLVQQAIDSVCCRTSLISFSSRLLAAILAYFGIRFSIDKRRSGCWMTSQDSCVVEPELDKDTSSGAAAAAAVVSWLKLAFGLDDLCSCGRLTGLTNLKR
jgi:hypothetical protein